MGEILLSGLVALVFAGVAGMLAAPWLMVLAAGWAVFACGLLVLALPRLLDAYCEAVELAEEPADGPA